MYKTERYTASIPVKDYIEGYVDIPVFRAACQACPNYDRIWSCPPYDFDVLGYWNRYQRLELLASRIIFDREMLSRTYTGEELDAIIGESLLPEKEKLGEELYKREALFPGSVSLSAGSCRRCRDGCSKPQGRPCRFPDKMRYSIESLGGNVGLTIEKLMGLHLEWMEKDRLPSHFILVCGLLIP